ncbi:hypothetical protein [Bradyrhizobium sp. 195]|uniref:hypothetical protein n=1 Tax=Bradyrhizobium sp. 195 TaxID=2782662 RepID=UPI002000BD65|nr:hypothetical protein [Bradyrhizobium sp. 195]UPK28025.1 hypothetical protein IVB26_05435 [Bradyrhizobium sp. 195]
MLIGSRSRSHFRGRIDDVWIGFRAVRQAFASLHGAEMSRVDARQPTVVDELRPWTMETDPGIE